VPGGAGERVRGGSVGMHEVRLSKGCGGQGHARRAHLEHEGHVCDAGGVKAQRLVEGRRGLPSRREGHAVRGGEVRAGRQEGLGWWRHTSGMHGNGLTQGLGAKGTRGERTLNMKNMSVTLEVSKLSGWLNAEADCRVEGRAHAMRGGEVRAGRQEGLGWWRHTRGMHVDVARLKAWGPRARAERAQRT